MQKWIWHSSASRCITRSIRSGPFGRAWRVSAAGRPDRYSGSDAASFEEARELYADVWLGFSEVEIRRFLTDTGFEEVQSALVHRETEPPHFQTILAVAEKPKSLEVPSI